MCSFVSANLIEGKKLNNIFDLLNLYKVKLIVLNTLREKYKML